MAFLNYLVSALVLGLGLMASQTSVAEFVSPAVMPPIAPVFRGGCGTCSINNFNPGFFPGGGHAGAGYGYGGFGYGYPYGRYRYGYGFNYMQYGFLNRGGCGYPYWRRYRGCGRGRRSFRAFSLSIGFGGFGGGFGLSISSIRF